MVHFYMSETNYRVAVVQAASKLFDQAACLQKVRDFTAEAADKGAKLVLFPEAFVSGYPRGLDFGAVVGSRSSEGRDTFKRYWESSVDIPATKSSPAMATLSEIAKTNQVMLVVGIIERDGGTLYCTVVFFDDKGTYLGKHRKLMPTGSERLVWGFGDGSTLPVFDTDLGKVGAVICWENYMPLLRTTMYQKGIQIYCAPTADHRDSWIASMQHIACEGRCFVLSCNQYMVGSDYPKDLRPSHLKKDDVATRGGSCIVDPFGNFLVEPNFEGEAVLYADIDLDEIARGKYDFDVVGHYSRPDVFSMEVDESPKTAVTSFSSAQNIEIEIED